MDTTLGNKSRIGHSGYGYSKRRCESVTTWFINTFLPKHQLTIEIIHHGIDGDWGYCDWVGSPCRPRTFEIELRPNMSGRKYVITLLHELVHLRQWVHGTLTMKSGKFVWKGEDIHHIDYMNQPHEIEAFKEEGILYRRYMKEVHNVTVQEPTQYFPNRLTQPL